MSTKCRECSKYTDTDKECPYHCKICNGFKDIEESEYCEDCGDFCRWCDMPFTKGELITLIGFMDDNLHPVCFECIKDTGEIEDYYVQIQDIADKEKLAKFNFK